MNHFDIQARRIGRTFINRTRKMLDRDQRVLFYTGKHRENQIVGISTHALLFVTEESKSPNRLSKQGLERAIRYLLYRRTATRKEIEHHSSGFNSALLGLLRFIFLDHFDSAKIAVTARGLLRLTLKGVRFFFSGLGRGPGDMRTIQRNGGMFILLSYVDLRERSVASWKPLVQALGLKVLLDPGEYTLHREREAILRAQRAGRPVHARWRSLEPVSLEQYMNFIALHRDVLFAWLNLDVTGDAIASRANAEAMQKAGLSPIEVWHIQSPWSALDELVEKDLPVIAIGGSAHSSVSNRARWDIFTELFRRHPHQNFHLLGGSFPFVSAFPWFSADATTWLYGAIKGEIVTPAGRIKAPAAMTREERLSLSIGHHLALEPLIA